MSWHIPDPERQPDFYADVAAKRLVAFVVDTGLILAVALILTPFTAFTAVFFFPFFLAIVGFAYRVITLTRGSATWGMRLMAIEFRTLQGERLDLQTATLHTLGLTVSFMIPVIQVVSVVLMLTGARGQGLTDLALGTVALNRRASA